MGTNCAPLVADLFWLCYGDFMLSLSDNNQADVVQAFNSTSRYLDDLLNINAKFGVCVDEDHSKRPTLYWLTLKLHKIPCTSRFIAYSSTCTITELSLFFKLTSYLTAIKIHVISYSETVLI